MSDASSPPPVESSYIAARCSLSDTSCPAADRCRLWLEKLFTSGHGSDCAFQAEDGGPVFRLHRLVLEPFPALLSLAGTCEDAPVTVAGVRSDVLNSVFAFLYGCELSSDNFRFILEVFQVAVRFEILELDCRCVELLEQHVTLNSCYEALAVSRKVGHERLAISMLFLVCQHLATFPEDAPLAALSFEDILCVCRTILPSAEGGLDLSNQRDCQLRQSIVPTMAPPICFFGIVRWARASAPGKAQKGPLSLREESVLSQQVDELFSLFDFADVSASTLFSWSQEEPACTSKVFVSKVAEKMLMIERSLTAKITDLSQRLHIVAQSTREG